MPLIPGGHDAGDALITWYEIAENHFPILADDPVILEDTAAGTFGLAWFYRLNGALQPEFAVRDDIDVDAAPYIGFHEAGHAFMSTVAILIARKRGTDDWLSVFDEIRTRYWKFRGFPGIWWDGQLRAINGGGWYFYPDESFADAFAHAMLHLYPIPGYITGEWTENYNTAPIWSIADKAVAFMRGLAQEAEEEELDAEDKANLAKIANFSEESFNKLNALTQTLVVLLDRLGDGRDVASGSTGDKLATRP